MQREQSVERPKAYDSSQPLDNLQGQRSEVQLLRLVVSRRYFWAYSKKHS